MGKTNRHYHRDKEDTFLYDKFIREVNKSSSSPESSLPQRPKIRTRTSSVRTDTRRSRSVGSGMNSSSSTHNINAHTSTPTPVPTPTTSVNMNESISLSDVIMSIEQQQQQRERLQEGQDTEELNGIDLSNDTIQSRRRNAAISNHNNQSYFRVILRNLLVLDYFIMMILMPFSIYNMIRGGFNVVTMSQDDFILQIISYFKYSKIISDDKRSILGYKDDSGMDLLGKFHNIVIYYTSFMLKYGLNLLNKPIFRDFHKTIQWFIGFYSLMVKLITIYIYLLYGLVGTMYLYSSIFFFLLCLVLTIIRRYKLTHRLIVSNIFQTLSSSSSETSSSPSRFVNQ